MHNNPPLFIVHEKTQTTLALTLALTLLWQQMKKHRT